LDRQITVLEPLCTAARVELGQAIKMILDFSIFVAQIIAGITLPLARELLGSSSKDFF